MSTEKKETKDLGISQRTFFDTDHDNNFTIQDDLGEDSTDIDDTTKKAAEESNKLKTTKKKPEVEATDDKSESDDEVSDTDESDTEEDESTEDSESTEEDNETEDSESEDENTEFSFSPLVTDLIDEGVLDIDNIEEYEDSSEGFRKAITDTVEKKFEGLIKSLSPEAQRLIELEQNGGDIHKLLELESVDYNNIDLEDEDTQKLLIKNKMISDGYEEEEIEEKLKDLEDLNKLDKEAKIAHRFLAKKAEAEKQALVEEAKARQETERVTWEKKAKEFKEKVVNTTKIGDFKLTKKDANKLYEYMTTGVKRDPKTNRILTQLEIDSSPEENQLKQAYYQMIGYDFKTVEKKATTNVSKNIKKELSKYQDTNQSGVTLQKPKEAKLSTKVPDYWAGDRNNTL